MVVHPRIIPGWPSYLGIPEYLDKGEAYGCPSRDNPGMVGIPGYLDKGGRAYDCPSWDKSWGSCVVHIAMHVAVLST